MEIVQLTFQYASFFLLISCLLIIFIHGCSKKLMSRSYYRKQEKQITGPWNLPIIGSIHQFIDTNIPPHHVLTKLSHKHGPLIHLKLGRIPFIVISSSHLAKEITKTHDLAFAGRPEILPLKIFSYNYSDVGLSQYGKDWKQRRKMCVLEIFSPKRVRSFSSIRWDEYYGGLINSVQTSSKVGKQVNLTQEIMSYTSSMVCKAVFGKVFRNEEMVAELMKETSEVTAVSLLDMFPCSRILHLLFASKSRVLQVHKKLDNLFNDVINQRRKMFLERQNKGKVEFPEEGVVDILLNIQENGNLDFLLTNENIKGILFNILFGGIKPSSALVIWAMSEMMRKPDIMARAQREIRDALKTKKKTRLDENDIQEFRYLKWVIKETLRLHPTAPLIPRESREECQIGGYYIPNKTSIFMNVWAIARDKDHWPDPDSFIPERFENNAIGFSGNHYEYISFGSGRRKCPGGSFGLANVELPLSLLLYHFDWKLPDGLNPKDLDMSETIELSCSRKKDLNLIPTLYYPSF